MKTERSKSFLEQALRNLPTGHAMTGVRNYISRALNELITIEAKKAKAAQQKPQLTPQEKWKIDLEHGIFYTLPFLTNQQKINAVADIDKMIDAEQDKINQVREQSKDNEDQQILG